MKKIFLPLLLCLLLPCVAWAEGLPSLNLAGLMDLLARNKGKVVMLNFFATWCPPCRVEIPELIKTSRVYADKGALVISLAVDEDATPVAPFVKKMGMDYPVYLAGRDITRAYQVSSIPHNAFYAKDGTLVLSEPGMADESMLKMVIDKLLSQK
ncbi:TlpA disulfide reductase family protein [uncultured Desulfovibrio sp.]|uniref:TlpA family protein disulfide reductase n=1 Tax=uncultured Desulfovibrio sp. TaxID=167968 RepID=UPI00039A02AE|nr:TlpA disulfide reductase family protein [uncultured Desulfovibrio sp.]